MFIKFKYCTIIPLLAWVTFNACPLAAQTTIDSSQAETEDNQQPDELGEENGDSKSKWGKFLPLPIFITEPAIGEGLGGALIYFHHEKRDDGLKVTTGREISNSGRRSKPPPTATAIFGAYTNDDTAAVGIGHSNSFMNDRYRVMGAAADARINSQFFVADTPFAFTLDGDLIFASLKRRLGDSSTFLGITMSFADANVNFKTSLKEFDGVSVDDFDFVDVGLAASAIYDTRDNTMMPGSGYVADLTAWRYDQSLGGDFDYSTTRLKGNSYRQLGQKYTLALRLDVSTASGDVPFYNEPYVRLRGIPALRYQGKTAGAVEIEGRRRLSDRWMVSVFAGAGFTDIDQDRTETRDTINTIGVGLRFLAVKEQDAWVGIDIAEGPEDVAWYIQMGNAW